jgi:hypothetical protein
MIGQTAILLTLVIITGCAQQPAYTGVDETAKGARRDPTVALILARLASAPSWSEARGASGERDRQRLALVAESIAHFPVAQIRVAADVYSEEARSKEPIDMAALSKLFVLNRYVFAIPPDKAGAFPSCWDAPSDNELWPVSQKDLKLALTGTFRGFAGDYWPVAELNTLNQEYGPRNARRTSNCGRSSLLAKKGASNPSVYVILEYLRSAPPWSTMGGNTEEKERRELISATLKISRFDTATIRAAVALYILEADGSPDGLDMLSKIMVLNPVLFAIPDQPFLSEPGTRPIGHLVSEAWPLYFTASGPQIIDRAPALMGNYDELGDFDYFSEKYGRRSNVWE